MKKQWFKTLLFFGEKADEEKALDEILTQVKSFEKLLGEKANADEIKALKDSIETFKNELSTLTNAKLVDSIKAINDANAKLFKQVLEMQEKAAQEQENGKAGGKKAKSLKKDEVEKFVKSIFPDGAKGEKNRKHTTMELKAVEDFGPTTITGDATPYTGRVVDPELYQRKRKTNIMLDHFAIRTIGVPSLVYLRKIEEALDEEDEPVDFGGAAWIACGAPKPKRSFRLTTGTAEAKKVAIFTTIPDCLLQDVDSMMRWIEDDFADEMREKFNEGLLEGNPAVDELEPLGLKTNAIQFSATPAFDEYSENPTYIDAIFAIAALMAFNREELGKVFVSSDVWYAMLALKGSDERYLNNAMVYTNALGQLFIAGVEVVKVDQDDVPSTHILAVGVDPGFKVYTYGGVMMETGLNGEDFREDKTSIRGWQRVLSYIAEERENSVLYDTFANIFTAITKVVPEAPVLD
jgi:HK97 family phage major capsid protein